MHVYRQPRSQGSLHPPGTGLRFLGFYFFIFLFFCFLSSVFLPLARKIVQTLPTSSIFNELFYSKLARLKRREKVTPVTQDIFFEARNF